VGLRLADATDPLRRAELSADAAELLARSVVTLAAAGNSDAAGELGGHLRDMLQSGVAGNLDKMEAADKNKVRDAVKKLRERTVEVVALLQQNLDHASAADRPGLEQAVKASGHGRDAVLQATEKHGPVLVPGP
jgi:hypothetical protein